MPIPAIRTQVDDLTGYYSKLTELDCTDMPDLARQEFKDETDVNKVLARYGVDGLPRKPEYSAVDYDMDLQQSLEAITEAERAVGKLPPELRAKYGNWNALFNGAHNGDLPRDLQVYQQEKEAAEKAAIETKAAAAAAITP